jgi:hypothetical protein
VCLKTTIMFLNRTVQLFTDNGPLNVDRLYKGWTVTQRQDRRDALARWAEEAGNTVGNDHLRQMFAAQAMRSMGL